VPATPTPTTIRSIATAEPDEAILDEASEVLRRGGLVAFPTETVYGLGADATNPAGVARIFEAKGRPATNPLIVHAGDIAGLLLAVSEWPPAAETLARTFWPGPLSLVLPRSGLIPDIVTAGLDTVGVRVPDCIVAQRLLYRFGRPVAAPSANRSTHVSPTTAAHVLKDLEGRVDLILDAGPTPVGIESTVLDLTADPPRLLRPGAITAGQIGAVLGVDVATNPWTSSGESMTSPGQLEVHYAPRASVILLEPTQIHDHAWPAASYGLIVAGHDLRQDIGSPTFRVDWRDPARSARELYSTLHRYDEAGLSIIYVVLPPNDDAWQAVRDRLWRASRRWAQAGGANQCMRTD
jgi:L-threonylcarbamoyladenylate synthase